MVNKQSNASQSAHYLQEHGRELKYQEPFSRVADCIFKICRKVRRRECGTIHLGAGVCVCVCVCVRESLVCGGSCPMGLDVSGLRVKSKIPPPHPNGFCAIVACSWFAHNIIRAFYNPYTPANTK